MSFIIIVALAFIVYKIVQARATQSVASVSVSDPAASSPVKVGGKSLPNKAGTAARKTSITSGRSSCAVRSGEKDPYEMIRESVRLLDNVDEGGITAAERLMARAYELYPDNLDVREKYAHILSMRGYIDKQIGAYPQAFDVLSESIRHLDALFRQGRSSPMLHDLYMRTALDCGETACMLNNWSQAVPLLSKVDPEKYPYAAALKAMVLIDAPGKHGAELKQLVSILDHAVKTDNWQTDLQHATGYYVLSLIYSKGYPNGIRKNTKYAYECIQKCSQLDKELAEKELNRYSKSVTGRILVQ